MSQPFIPSPWLLQKQIEAAEAKFEAARAAKPARRKLAKSAKVRVVIDGICLQTTAGNLRTGSISISLYDAWKSFEEEHKATGIIGRGSHVWDVYLQRHVNVQFDLY